MNIGQEVLTGVLSVLAMVTVFAWRQSRRPEKRWFEKVEPMNRPPDHTLVRAMWRSGVVR